MVDDLQGDPAPLDARLSRFALCVARSSNQSLSAIRLIKGETGDQEPISEVEAFRQVLQILNDPGLREPAIKPAEPASISARFSALCHDQRVAFALVVIEEFSPEQAADIMLTSQRRVHELLSSSRDCLFEPADDPGFRHSFPD